MVQIQLTYEGGLRCRATHGPSGAQLLTDAPVDNHGKGESYSPTDLVATATGTCMLTILAIRAEQLGLDVTGATVTVEKFMVADPLRRIGRLEVELRLPIEVDGDTREALEEAALHCPVVESLSPRIEVPARFAWGAGAPTS